MRISLLFLALVLLTACFNTPETATDEKLHSGIEGVVLSLPDEGLPEEVLEGERFMVPLIVENLGAYTLEREAPGAVQLTIEPDLVLFESWDVPPGAQDSGQTVLFPLRGKSVASIAGEKSRLRVILKAKPIAATLNARDTRVVFSVCYPYRTQFEEQVCIDPSPDSQMTKSCEPETLESVDGQGGPIEITEVQQLVLPGEHPDDVNVQFIIRAENSGDGLLLHHEDYPLSCLGRDGSRKPGVYIKKIAFSDFSYVEGKGGDIECYPLPMREVAGGYETRCLLTQGIQRSTPAYTTPLSIELAYGYKETISHEVRILSVSSERSH
ncbi:MAG: hypothetical protein Q7S65_04330 [Nanoarchaeota archaeon]|nr:hypothetical protein [Nanoarchaeota archaeon]